MISFYSDQKELEIGIAPDVIQELQEYRQTTGKLEAGGLLFTDAPNSNRVVITHASLPNRWDVRRWSLFKINVKAARSVIAAQFKLGRHYIGEWHTHPETNPTPSGTDKKTINTLFSDSDHQLHYLILMIVGSTPDFSKSYVALADGHTLHRCNEMN
jgi:integrative and conjugative element protein (TIGR02256 family)